MAADLPCKSWLPVSRLLALESHSARVYLEPRYPESAGHGIKCVKARVDGPTERGFIHWPIDYRALVQSVGRMVALVVAAFWAPLCYILSATNQVSHLQKALLGWRIYLRYPRAVRPWAKPGKGGLSLASSCLEPSCANRHSVHYQICGGFTHASTAVYVWSLRRVGFTKR